MKDPGRIVVIGAGPTGLGAAYRLHELGFTDYALFEAHDHPGGLASSYVDTHGFTWDVGGHVQFSHYRYYDEVLDRLMRRGWLEHERDAAVWLAGRFVPYPFQNNIHRLPPAERDSALADLERVAESRSAIRPAHFKEWISRSFGPTIAGAFLLPYNEKVWGYPLDTLDVGWTGERIAHVNLDRIRRNIAEERDDSTWGPNNTFRFPATGGTGAIWESVARALPAERLRYGKRVVSIDTDARTLDLECGDRVAYDRLISTMPLDMLCGRCSGLPASVLRRATQLRHSSVHVIGVGLRGDKPAALARKCWMYFPEPHSPYYRVTVFTNYSPHNAPAGDGLWSLMAEVCETPVKAVDARSLRRWTIEALRRDRLIGDRSEVVSFWHHREEHGYPTPFLHRDEVLDALLPALESRQIYSRGRFGAWKYEVSNQDHSFMQGVELVDRLLGNGDEPTLNHPQLVNSGAFRR